jgi:phosphatidylglycerophosphatase A
MAYPGIRSFAAKTTASVFYIGHLPFVPGTFGSMAGMGIFMAVRHNVAMLVAVFLISLAAGFLSAGRAETAYKKKDARYIVIDEVAGQLLTFLFVPVDPVLIVLGFVFFRILDTLKPFPAVRIQNMHGSVGIMGDDIVAGLYANLVLQVISRLMLHF